MKLNSKKHITLLSIFLFSIASLFAASGEESRPFDLKIIGTLSDSYPEINIKYNSSYLEDQQIISSFDFDNPNQQFTDTFSLIVGAYDLTDSKTLSCEISASPFYLYDRDDNTTLIDTGETPNITIIEKSKYPLTNLTPYTSSNKAFSVVIPSGYYKLSEYIFADFTFDVTPGNRNYIAGIYRSTIVFSLSVD